MQITEDWFRKCGDYDRRQTASDASIVMDLRYTRAQQMAAHIMHIIDKHLCDHGEQRGRREASRDLVEAFYNAGVEVITDEQRASAGLPPRGATGMTAEELRIMEMRRIDTMLKPSMHLLPVSLSVKEQK